MKRLFAYKKYSIFLFLLFCSVNFIQAQIGVNTEKPIVTLDITSKSTIGTTAEGLIIPRLTLTELASKDSKYSTLHIGTLVYVTRIDGTASTKTSNVTTKGFYSFDGSEWTKFGDDGIGLDFFYMPTIILSIDKRDQSYSTSKSLFEVDLYEAYKNQLLLTNTSSSTKNPSGADLTVFDQNKLNYLITYYDKDVFKDMLVTDDGLLTYKLQDDIILTEKSFVNIIFKIK